MKRTYLVVVLALFSVLASAQAQEKAHVVFYRPHTKLMGTALKPSIYFDRIRITALPNGRYFEVEAAPGKYTLGADDMAAFAENPVELTARVRYYVRMSLVANKKGVLLGNGGHLQLDVIPDQEALAALKGLKPLDQPVYVLDGAGAKAEPSRSSKSCWRRASGCPRLDESAAPAIAEEEREC
jgi:hypothetical protein